MGMRYAFGVDEPWKTWVAYAKAGWDTITRHLRSLVALLVALLVCQASHCAVGLRHVLRSGRRPDIR